MRLPATLIHHDEDAEIYVNGKLVSKLDGYTTAYGLVPLGPDAASASSRVVMCSRSIATRPGEASTSTWDWSISLRTRKRRERYERDKPHPPFDGKAEVPGPRRGPKYELPRAPDKNPAAEVSIQRTTSAVQHP